MDILKTILGLFGGPDNLTAIIAALGGMTAIVSFFFSPIASFILQRGWPQRIKENVIWALCFVATFIVMYFSNAFTGSLLDVGTWVLVMPLMESGAKKWHDKVWGSNGVTKGLSTKIENITSKKSVNVNTFDTGSVVDAVEDLATAYVMKKAQELGVDKLTTPKGVQGTAGAIPSEPVAQLGGPTIPVAPLADSMYAKDAVPLITPAPSVQAQVKALEDAIENGYSAEEVANGGTE